MNMFEKFFKMGGKLIILLLASLGLYIAYHLLPVVITLGFFVFFIGGFIYWTYRLLKYIVCLLIKPFKWILT